jgi:hypothetical protein
MADDEAIARLAKQIDATRRSESLLESAGRIAELRRQGACQLHHVCAEFVSLLKSRLSQSLLELSPPAYGPEMFRESGVNLIQVTSQGRQMQIAFQATAQVFSTEKYFVPYILEGEIRTYNQKMLEHFEIRSQSLFYCVDNETTLWRFYDWRNPRNLLVDPELLAGLMQRLF